MRCLSTRRLFLVSLGFVIALSWTRAGAAQQLVSVAGALLTPAEAAAVKPAAPATSGPNYGVTSPSSYTVGPCDAGARDETVTFSAFNCQVLAPLTTVLQTDVGFPVHLPTGALITSVTVNYFDNVDGGEPAVGLFRLSPGGVLEPLFAIDLPIFSGGNNSVTANPPSPIQVDNSYAYTMLAILFRPDVSHNHGLYSIEFHYQLQVSPAPATPTFTDVATDNPFFQYIEALAASGITGGCGAGIYCPNNPVTRGQMAVFLAKALGLHFPN